MNHWYHGIFYIVQCIPQPLQHPPDGTQLPDAAQAGIGLETWDRPT